MADNTIIAGGDLIADDEITDGGVADGAKVQRVKPGFGPDGDYTEVQPSAGLPVDGSFTILTGTFSLPDSDAVSVYDGSTLAIGSTDVLGKTSWSIQYNYYEFAIAVETSDDATVWFDVPTNFITSETDVSVLLAHGPIPGRYLRARVTGTNVSFVPATSYPVSLMVSTAVSAVVVLGPSDQTPLNVNVVSEPPPGALPSVTSVAAATTDTELIAANSTRKWLGVYNDSTSLLYLRLGAGASSTSYTVQVQPSAYFELPGYIGAVHGIWVTATGNALCTEVSP